jgi:hypothetical protein
MELLDRHQKKVKKRQKFKFCKNVEIFHFGGGGGIEHKYVTFQSHKNLEKKGYYKCFGQKCQKNQNFKFCPKFSY